jgi:hypothetical protein
VGAGLDGADREVEASADFVDIVAVEVRVVVGVLPGA